MTNWRHDFCDPDVIQHDYLDKLGMRYPQDEDPYLQEQYRQRQKIPKLEKWANYKRIKISRKKCRESKN